MVRYFILIKRKSSKSWLGAIPAKRGTTMKQLQSVPVRKGFVKRIVSEAQLKRIIAQITPRRTVKRRVVRRRPATKKRVMRRRKRR